MIDREIPVPTADEIVRDPEKLESSGTHSLMVGLMAELLGLAAERRAAQCAADRRVDRLSSPPSTAGGSLCLTRGRYASHGYTLDEWLVAIHILSAIVWVSGSFVTQLYAIRAQPGARVRWARSPSESDPAGMRTFLPASLICSARASGSYLATSSRLRVGRLGHAIVIGLSIVTGAGFLGPESGRIGAAGR